MKKPVIVWIRNDLRLHDNPCLYEATLTNAPVVMVYIQDEKELRATASCVWKKAALESFSNEARNYGFGLYIRTGNPAEVIRSLALKLQAQHIFWNRRYKKEEIEIDTSVQKTLEFAGLFVHTFQGNLLIEPWKLFSKTGKPFRTFAPYWKTFQSVHPEAIEIPSARPNTVFCHNEDNSCYLRKLFVCSKDLAWPQKIVHGWHISEDGGKNLLHEFCSNHMAFYKEKRDFPAADITSRLSPYLHFGQISVRRVWNCVLDTLRSAKDHELVQQADAFLRQIAWREFTHMILYHFPETEETAFREKYTKIAWEKSAKALEAWQYGKTGFPIVDAGMRQLYETGFMHNRLRLIVGSFLVKQMLHSWKEGRDWFLQTLFDADAANNSFGWQYVSGSGVDAAPSFYIFNPILQGEKFDPDGAFVRRYIPELTLVPKEFIHRPFEASSAQLADWNVRLGIQYPYPILDLKTTRIRAQRTFSSNL